MTATTTVVIPTPALEWLDRVVAPILANKSTKRLAFRVTVGDGEMILAADSTGKSHPTYDLLLDQEGGMIDLRGKPTAITGAPENIENLERLLLGLDVELPREDDEAALEAEVAEALAMSVGEDEGFAPTPKKVKMAGLEPAPIPMPGPVKGKGKGKGKKEVAPKQSLRTKILDKITNELGVDIPTEEEMFRKFAGNPAVKFISFKELAACNHPAALMTETKGEFAKALNEVMGYHRDNNIRNILNLSAEIDRNRVLALVATVIRYGRLIHPLEACTITGDIPHSAKMAVTGHGTETFDEKVYQVWTGRHRAWALAFIYGEDVKLPVMLSEKPYQEAAEECVESNNSRPRGKAEQIHYEQVQRTLTMGDSPAAQFASLKGDKKKIANFTVFHTIVQPDSDVFSHPEYIQVGAKRTPKNITLPFYRSAIEFAIASSGMKAVTLAKLSPKTTRGINLIVVALDELFHKIEQKFLLDAERKLVWTYYSAGAYGNLLGEQLSDAIEDESAHEGEAVTEATDAVMDMIVGLFKQNTYERAKELLAKEPPSSLSSHLALCGGDSDEEDDDGILS